MRHLLTETLMPVCAPDFHAVGTKVVAMPDDFFIHTTGTDEGWGTWAAANGRPPPDPAVLLALWLYATIEGVVDSHSGKLLGGAILRVEGGTTMARV